MAISISAGSSQSQNSGANQSTVYGSGSMTLTVGSWSGLQQYGIVYIGGAEYWSAGYTSMSQGGSWGWSASRTYTHDANGYRGDVGVSVYHFVDGTSYHQGSATAPTQGAINYTIPPGTPGVPSLSRSADGTSITITSQIPSSSAAITDYNYRWSTDNSSWSGAVAMGTGRVATHSSLTNYQDYYYQTRAYADGAWGAWSGSSGINGVPTVPTSVVGTASSSVSGRITVTWTAPSDTNGGITNYHVYRDDAYIGQTGNSNTSFVDDGRTKGTSYAYKVVAYNSIGYSSTSTASTPTQAPGVPYAATLDSVTPSTDTFGKVSLAWTAPSTAVGTIQNYYMYAVYGGVIQKTVSTGSATTSGDITGLDERKVYTFYVRARNQFSIDNGTPGELSNTIDKKSPGPPTAPTGLTADAPFYPPGTIDLEWVAPSDVGTEGGTITGYSIYIAGNPTPVKETYDDTTSTTIEDLVPATSYTFNVRARNEIADEVGTFSVASASATATAQGDPEAPTNLTVVSDPAVAGRLVLTWTPPAGYNTGFRVYTSSDVLVANISVPRLEIDGLVTNTSYSYKVRARNPLTDLTGSDGGPFSSVVAGVVGGSSTQAVPSISVLNSTSNSFVGTFNLISTTATTMSYARTASNVPFASVPVNGGSTVNNTNTNLNNGGTPYVITVVGTQAASTEITYTRAGSDIPANTSTPSGTMYNNTNAIFNGNYEVLASPAPDSVAKTVSYTKVNSDITSRAASGPVTNNSNAVYNGEYVISDVTETTISYAKTNDDIEESDAFGVVYNKTNTDIFNGTFTLTDTPDYRTVEYSTGDLAYAENLITNPSFEFVNSGTSVIRTNLITNPSFETNVTGWLTTNASLARSSAVAKYGTHSGLVSPSNGYGSIKTQVSLSSAGIHTFSVWVYSESATQVRLSTDAGAIGAPVSVPTETWTRLSLSFLGGVGWGVNVSIQSENSTTPFYVDGALVELSTAVNPYFDGSTVDSLGWDYGWSGTAHASTSTAKALATAGFPTPVGYTSTESSISTTSEYIHSGSQSVRVNPYFENPYGTAATSGDILSVAVQADGKTLIVAENWQGTYLPYTFCRINVDGSLDTAFQSNISSFLYSSARGVAVQPDGKIIIVTPDQNILRLNQDGTEDTAFTSNVNSSGIYIQSPAVNVTIKILADGKIVFGFLDYTNPLVCLNADGTANSTFNSNIPYDAYGKVVAIEERTDGKIVVAGPFNQSWGGTTVKADAVLLNADGTLNTAFNSNMNTTFSYYATVEDLAIQPDGKILLCGVLPAMWEYVGGDVTYKGVVRINSDGTRDTSFITTANLASVSLPPKDIILQSDGKIIVSGSLTSWAGTPVGRILRLNADGSFDASFSTAVADGANSTPTMLTQQADGKIIVAGGLTSWNNTPVGRIVRLNADGSIPVSDVDLQFTATTTSGATYTLSAWVYSTSTKSIRVDVGVDVGDTISLPANVWTRVHRSFVADSTSTTLSIFGIAPSTAFYVDDMMLQESSDLSSYFDGDTDDTAATWPVVYTWSDTPHASTSIREVGGTLPSVGAELLSPYGQASRIQSEANLQIRYRSGWIG